MRLRRKGIMKVQDISPELMNTPSITLSGPDVERLVSFTLNRSTLITPEDNLTSLRLWRMMMGKLSVPQRAKLASNPSILRSALDFIPSTVKYQSLSNAISSGQYSPQVSQDLIEEQQAWISSGLLPNHAADLSGFFWPAMSLAFSFQAKPSPSTIKEMAVDFIGKDLSSALEALLPILSPQDWQEVLSTKGTGINPLFFSILDMPFASKIRPLLDPDFVNQPTSSGLNGFSGCLFPPAEICAWIKAGMDPASRSKQGDFPEERGSLYQIEKIMNFSQELNKFRPKEMASLATWRLAVNQLEYSSLDQEVETPLVRALLGPVPPDPSHKTSSSVLEQIQRHRIGNYPSVAKNLFDFMTRNMEQGNITPRWLDQNLGGPHGRQSLMGFLTACVASNGVKIYPDQLNDLQEKLNVSDEQVILATLTTPSNAGLSWAVPKTGKASINYTNKIDRFIKSGTLDAPHSWAKAISGITDEIFRIENEDGPSALMLLNTLSQVACLLPREMMTVSSSLAQAMITMAYFFESPRTIDNWHELEIEYEDASDFPIADLYHVKSVFSQFLSAVSDADMSRWWHDRHPRDQKNITQFAPTLSSRIKSARLSKVAQTSSSEVSKARPRMM